MFLQISQILQQFTFLLRPQHYIYSINLCHVAGLQLRITSGHYHKSTGMLLYQTMNIATTFCSTGIPSVFLHPSEAQHGDLGILQKNDLLLLISNSGKTREIVELTRLAHNLDPDLKFIVITGNPDSPLAQESDVCLSTGKPAEVCTLGMTPTTSTTAMTVSGDILVVQTMKKTQFTIEEYSKRHHGGYLGEKSRSLCEK